MDRRVLFCFVGLVFVSYVTRNGHKGQAFYFRGNILCFPPNIPQISEFIQNGLTQQFTLVFPSMTKAVCVLGGKKNKKTMTEISVIILEVINCRRATKVSYRSTIKKHF